MLTYLYVEFAWTELEEAVEELPARKLKHAAGRPPRLRALIGAVVFWLDRRPLWIQPTNCVRSSSVQAVQSPRVHTVSRRLGRGIPLSYCHGRGEA
jgi:hypothetical protein